MPVSIVATKIPIWVIVQFAAPVWFGASASAVHGTFVYVKIINKRTKERREMREERREK